MGNQRVFYACQGVCFNNKPLLGVQSISLDTQQDVVNVDQFGTLEIAGSVANLPQVNISLSRVISSSGHTDFNLIYSGTLEQNINKHDHTMCLFIGQDTSDFIKSSPAPTTYNILFSGVSIDNVNYEFNTDGFFNENIDLVCYGGKYFNECPVDQTIFEPTQGFAHGAQAAGKTTFRRQNFDIQASNIATGIIPSGSRIQSVSFDSNFGINAIEELGMSVYNPHKKYRYATLPIETDCTVSVILEGSGLDFYQFDPANHVDSEGGLCNYSGLSKLSPLSFQLCSGLNINLGSGMLSNVSYQGGGTDGANVVADFNFTSLNTFTVTSIPPEE